MLRFSIKKEVLNLVIPLLIFLMFSTSISALTINHIYGSDEINGTIAEEDLINAEITTAYAATSVKMNNLGVCTGGQGVFECILEYNLGDPTNFIFEAFLNENILDLGTANLIVDNQAPIINNYAVSTSALGVLFEFQTADALIGGVCSGFKKIEFLANDVVIQEINYSKEDDNCTKSITQEISYNQGANFKVKVTDKIGNTVESTSEFVNITKAAVYDLGFEYDGNPISRISHITPITGTVVFYVDAQSIEGITADFSQLIQNVLYQEAYSSVDVPLSSCYSVNNSEKYKCGVSNVVINPENASVALRFNVIANGGVGSSSILTFSFTIDDEAPRLVSIETNYFHDDKYYFASNEHTEIILRFDDTQEQFNRKKVFYEFNNIKYAIHHCDAGVCYAYINTPCRSGSTYDVSLVTSGGYRTEDDAGNPVQEDYSAEICCDSVVPYDNSMGISESGQASYIEFLPNSYDVLIVGGQPLEIEAHVYEDGPTLTTYANLTSIGGSYQEGECSKNQTLNKFICKWSIERLINEHMQKEIEFSFTDLVNHSYTTTAEIVIKKSANQSETTPNCVEIDSSSVKFSPEQINRIALDMSIDNGLTYPLYGSFMPEMKNSCRNYKIYEQQERPECFVKFSNGTILAGVNLFSDFILAYPENVEDELNYLEIIPLADANNYDENYKIICNLSFVIGNEKTLFSQPLVVPVEWKLEFKNSAFGTPGEEYTKKLKEFDKGDGFEEMIGWANMLLATMSELCSAKKYIDKLGGAGTVLELGEAAVCIYSETYCSMISAGHVLTKLAPAGTDESKVQKIEDNAQSALEKGAFGLFDSACRLASCSIEEEMNSEAGKNWWMQEDLGISTDPSAGEDSSAAWGGTDSLFADWDNYLLDDIDQPNMYNSLVTCIMTNCWQGVIYHLNKYREANCDKFYCLKRQAQYGLGISQCYEALDTFICKEIVGEIFEIPYIRDIKNLAGNVNSLIQNLLPKLMTDVWSSLACGDEYMQKTLNEPTRIVKDINVAKVIMCEAPLALGRIIRTERFGSNSGHFMYPNNPDICAMAHCNEEDETKCETNAGLISKAMPQIQKAVGFDIFGPSSMSSQQQIDLLQSSNRNRGSSQSYYDTLNDYVSSAYNGETDAAQDAAFKLRYQYGLDVPTDETSIKGYKEDEGIVDDTIDLLTVSEINPNSQTEAGTNLDNYYGQQGSDYGWDSISDLNDAINLNDYIDQLSPTSASTTMNDISLDLARELSDSSITLSTEGLGNRAQDDINQNANAILTNEQRDYAMNHPPQEFIDALGGNLNYGTGDKTYTARINELNAIINDPKTTDEAKAAYETQLNQLNAQLNQRALEAANCLGSSDPQNCDLTILKINPDGTHSLKDDISALIVDEAETAESAMDALADHLAWQKQREEIAEMADEVMKLFWNMWFKDWSSTSQWNKELSEFSETYINPDSWENTFCDPENSILYSPHEDIGGVAFDCTGDHCNSVLSFTMERSPYNWTNQERTDDKIDHYIYTWVYLLGPVQEDFKFNIYFKYKEDLTENKFCVYKNDVTGTCEMTTITDGEEISEQISFISKNKYETVCFNFDKKYPNAESGMNNAADHFCRSVVEDAFATGEPDKDYDSESGSSESGSGESTATYG